MCMDRVDGIYKGTSRKIETRYKVFFRYQETEPLQPLYVSLDKNLPEGVWLNEKDYRDNAFQGKEKIESSDGEEYPIGWHVFLTKEDVQSLIPNYVFSSRRVVRKVLCRGLLASGEEGNAVVEVYKYIKIEKET